MSRRILKFTLKPDITAIETADEPTFRWVEWQGEHLCVWAEATVGAGVTTLVATVPTGGWVPDDAIYLGSAQTDTFGQRLVFHVYRKPS